MMTGKTSAIIAMIAAILIVPSIGAVYAQSVYYGNVGSEGQTGANTLEEALKLARERVDAAERYPDSGSGTPYLALDGVLGSSLVSAGVFGGIAAAFFVKSRGGRYVAQGMG